MSKRHIPIKFVVMSLVVLAALGFIQVSNDARKLLLIGWSLAFFGVLALWQESGLYTYPSTTPVRLAVQPVEELCDTDRFTLQHDHHVWSADPKTGNSKEIV